MKYLIMIHHNPQSQAVWDAFSAAQKAAGIKAYTELTEQLVESGELVFGHALAEADQARRVTAVDGQVTSVDGPYAESKEYLAGFFMIDCDSLDRATEVAALIPEARMGLVEVRPILTYGPPDLM